MTRFRSAASAALLGAALAGLAPRAAAQGQPAPAAILQEMRAFRQFGSVLYVAAHPDDENTQLIAYLARGRNLRTAYLSLTRGDGGQNILGPEFGDLLGVIRTNELLAARAVDGGEQFFSRARDFGYSKDYQATLSKWDREQVLSDVVRVIRTFRPDVIVTRFPPEGGGTHGHHTASAVLALEAFQMAGDPKAFPDQLPALAPWRPRRILWNGFFPGGAAPADGFFRIPIDGTDSVTGASFAALAAKSRSMHQSQGFANFSVASQGTGPRTEAFKVLAGEPAAADILDGVDTTWNRTAGGADVARLADALVAGFNPQDPAASVPAILELRGRLGRMPDGPDLDYKRRQLDRLLAHCIGLSVSTSADEAEVAPGERVVLRHAARVGSAVPVRWVGVRYPGEAPDLDVSRDLAAGADTTVADAVAVPRDAPLSQPYWLRSEGTPGMFEVADSGLIGRPVNPPALRVDDVFRVGGQTLVVSEEALASGGGRAGPVSVVAPVELSFADSVVLLQPGASHELTLAVTAARDGASGTVGLGLAPGWSAAPSNRAFRLARKGDRAELSFTLTAPAETGSAWVSARATVGGSVYTSGRLTIDYPHIPRLVLQPPARVRAVSVPLQVRARRVGYLPGAGDSVAGALGQMGLEVRILSDGDLTPAGLRGLDAVVIGVRAFNTRKDIGGRLDALFSYVEAGGTLVEQYNTPNGLQTARLAPFEMKLDRNLPRYRVTDERSAVDILVPADPVFNAPNRISADDFTGWVQERGLDFASEWDAAHFTALIACSDRGEAPLKGGLLVAPYGKGRFVYTGLSFFRQLPAGVPGAYRLFANLVSLGR